MFETLLLNQYGLHLNHVKKSAVGAASDTWFLDCVEGKFVLKFPTASAINHPEAEPELCAFLRRNGVPACDFIKNREGRYISTDNDGGVLTVQRHLPGKTLEWNTASEAILLESAELLGKIHCVLRDYPALPEGIGAGFFAYMTPQRALESYECSHATAVRLGDKQIAEELEWRAAFMKRFPSWSFNMSALTVRNTHGDYFYQPVPLRGGPSFFDHRLDDSLHPSGHMGDYALLHLRRALLRARRDRFSASGALHRRLLPLWHAERL